LKLAVKSAKANQKEGALLGDFMSWRDVVIKYTEEQVKDRVQRTGYCRRCQKPVVKYQRCSIEDLASAKTNCPMKEE